MDVTIPQKLRIAKAFGRKALTYDSTAFIQRRMIERLSHFVTADSVKSPWLDAGCGTGLLGSIFQEKSMATPLFYTDLAFASLRFLRGKSPHCRVFQSDIETMPVTSGAFATVVTTSVLHWLHEQENAIREICRILMTGGHFVFTEFLEGSFSELCGLRQKRKLPLPVHFLTEEELHAMLAKCGLAVCRYAMQSEECYFPSALQVLKNVSDVGATAVAGARLSRRQIMSLCQEYDDEFGTEKGVRVSWRSVCGIARKDVG